jgi:hypothetical protein
MDIMQQPSFQRNSNEDWDTSGMWLNESCWYLQMHVSLGQAASKGEVSDGSELAW